MTISQKLSRSKQARPAQLGTIPASDCQEPLVALHSTELIRIEPIWEVAIDPHEGKLYQNYIDLHPGYNQLLVRQTVGAMLQKAALELPSAYRLIVRAGHRPLAVQRALLQEVAASYKASHPRATKAQALEFARTFVSDPDIKLPPHCCGAAVDVDLLEVSTGRLVDFGCPMNTDGEISFLHSNKINAQQKANRLLLLKAMLHAGFASNPNEWWHYSYGDQTWAWFYNKPQAIYEILDPQL